MKPYLLPTIAFFTVLTSFEVRAQPGMSDHSNRLYNSYLNSNEQNRVRPYFEQNPNNNDPYSFETNNGAQPYYNSYESYAGYGYPPADSQPGMSDDTDALYDSYLRSNH